MDVNASVLDDFRFKESDYYEQSCITCRYSEESYEDILGAGGRSETILVRRCPFVNDEIVNNDFLCEKFQNIH